MGAVYMIRLVKVDSFKVFWGLPAPVKASEVGVKHVTLAVASISSYASVAFNACSSTCSETWVWIVWEHVPGSCKNLFVLLGLDRLVFPPSPRR